MTTIETATSPAQLDRRHPVHRLFLAHSPSGRQVGESLFLDASPVKIGRSFEGRGFRVNDPLVSRVHAELRSNSEGFVLHDCESRNGTFVNGARVRTPHPMTDGDVIRAGNHVLLYQHLDESDCQHLLDPAPVGSRLIGSGPGVARVRHLIRLGAPGDLPVLITGETGVGKELVAEAIHSASRREGPFVALNCGSLPESLAESELFGHVGGAFTGARPRQGLFFRARGGTLLLDEIGEMDRALQKRLLRVLSTGEARPVGADQAQKVDVRTISATNVDLEAAVEKGDFRRDLYARLAGHVIRVPRLEERREDILLLLNYFLRKKKLVVHVSADAAEALLIHSWPFNVRELEQMVGVLEPVLRTTKRLDLEHLPEKLQAHIGDRPAKHGPSNPPPLSVLGIRRDVPPSRHELVELLELHGGNITEVARFFGKGRRQVYRWAKGHGIDISALRRPSRKAAGAASGDDD